MVKVSRRIVLSVSRDGSALHFTPLHYTMKRTHGTERWKIGNGTKQPNTQMAKHRDLYSHPTMTTRMTYSHPLALTSPRCAPFAYSAANLPKVIYRNFNILHLPAGGPTSSASAISVGSPFPKCHRATTIIAFQMEVTMGVGLCVDADVLHSSVSLSGLAIYWKNK